MNKEKRFAWFTVGAGMLLVLILVTFGKFNFRPPADTLAPRVDSSDARSDQTPPIVQDGNHHSSSTSPYVGFGRARTAAEAIESIERLNLERIHDANDARIYLSGVCSPYASGDYRKGSNEWLDRRMDEFCSSYADTDLGTMSMDELMVFQARGARSQIEAMLAQEQLNKSNKSMPERTLEDIALASDSPWEVHAALQIASERAYTLELMKVSLPANDSGRSREILALTAELQYCQLTGSCGPNSLAALRGCMFTGHCGPNVDYISQVRKVSAPAVFDSANTLSNALTRARNRLP